MVELKLYTSWLPETCLNFEPYLENDNSQSLCSFIYTYRSCFEMKRPCFGYFFNKYCCLSVIALSQIN